MAEPGALTDNPHVTQILRRVTSGEEGAVEELAPLVYERLHEMAAGLMRAERPTHTLQTTALVHEAWMRLVGTREAEWETRRGFFAAARKVMRNVLVSHARERLRHKRGGVHDRQPFEIVVEGYDERRLEAGEFLDLNEALETLEEIAPREAKVLDLRFFWGLSVAETADVLGLSKTTVEASYRTARAWLRNKLLTRGRGGAPG